MKNVLMIMTLLMAQNVFAQYDEEAPTVRLVEGQSTSLAGVTFICGEDFGEDTRGQIFLRVGQTTIAGRLTIMCVAASAN